jgi:hypothetical protein
MGRISGWRRRVDSDKTERNFVVARKTGSPFIGTRHLLIREDGTPFFYAFAKRTPMPSSWLVKRDLLVEDPFSDRAFLGGFGTLGAY